jgi:hypothetical protein
VVSFIPWPLYPRGNTFGPISMIIPNFFPKLLTGEFGKWIGTMFGIMIK